MKDSYPINEGSTASENAKPVNAGMCVHIDVADNGVIVKAYPRSGGMDNEKTYVFSSIEEALKEVPSIMSVRKAQAKDNKEQLDEPVEEDD